MPIDRRQNGYAHAEGVCGFPDRHALLEHVGGSGVSQDVRDNVFRKSSSDSNPFP